eukprot:7643-Heterococcus_DN1.PRE.4
MHSVSWRQQMHFLHISLVLTSDGITIRVYAHRTAKQTTTAAAAAAAVLRCVLLVMFAAGLRADTVVSMLNVPLTDWSSYKK